LRIARLLLERVPANELAVENAGEIINRCQQNLEEPPTEIPAADSAVIETATPAP